LTKLWAVPVEAIRHGATLEGALTLANLAALHARLAPTATVELTPAGWVAALIYSRPGLPKRQECAHVQLSWHPVENASAVLEARP
jgi:hypothetical protein